MLFDIRSAFMPTRELVLIVDPNYVPLLLDSTHLQGLRMVGDLQRIELPVTVHLLLPRHLIEPKMIPLANKIMPPLALTADISPPPFDLKADIPPEFTERLLANTEESKRSLSLLATGEAIQADGIVTDKQLLIDARWALYQHHRVRIIPLVELGDTFEIFAHGHSVFWSASSPERYFTFDVFYPWTHWKNKRFATWFNASAENLTNKDLVECLRSALLNRYPFLLYSRDMIRFYQLQMDFYSRRGLQRRFGMAVGFYVTTFYLLLWGMLDHLTIIAKWARDLRIDEKHCGIRSKTFRKEFKKTDPQLDRFLGQPQISKWISLMADVRHAAAHRTLAIPTELLTDTEESRKSDEEILEIIKQEQAAMYRFLPEALVKSMEPMMIRLWRVKKMKVVAPSMVYVKGETETYIRDPVISVDHDLQYLTAIMDAFLVVLFS